MKIKIIGYKPFLPQSDVVGILAEALNENSHLPKVESAILGIIEAMELGEEVDTYIKRNF